MNKALSLLLMVLLFVGCGGPSVKITPSNPATEKQYRLLRGRFAKEPSEKNQRLLENFIAKNPDSVDAGRARLLLGDHFYQQSQFDTALTYYAASPPFNSSLENQARIQSSRCFIQTRDYASASRVLDPVFKSEGAPEPTLEAAHKVDFMISIGVGDRLKALRTLVRLSELTTKKSDKDGYRFRAIDFLEGRLTESELETVSNSSDYGELRSLAHFRLGKLAFERSRFEVARKNLRSAAEFSQDGALKEGVNDLVSQIDARESVETKVIGVVLPLSGRFSKYGYKTLRGIQAGFDFFLEKSSGYRLAIVDSEGSPESARNAIKRLVVEDHAIAVIGGLVSKTATAEASKAQEFGLPMVCLSQKAGLTDIGHWVFRNAITSEAQADFLVDAAMTRLGAKRFALLFPNDPYGVEYANLFWNAVEKRGGMVSGAQVYEPTETDFRGGIRRLVGTYYVEDRLAEYKSLVEQWEKNNPRKEPPQDLLPPIIDFDALFVPDSVKALGQIAPMLAYNDVNSVRLVGTNLWNTQELIQRGEKFVEGAIFADTYLGKDVVSENAFFSVFKNAFGYQADVFEIQGFDSAIILRTAISKGSRTRDEVRQFLTTVRDVPGALGPLNMSPRREVLRPLSLLTVQNGQIVRTQN